MRSLKLLQKFGAGPTGQVLAQLLKLNGASHVTVAAPAGPKLDLIARLAAALGGAALVFNGLFSVPDSSFLGDLA
jgi:threonine dehydrogenase-like Zn-dependent dehydrogenase